MLLAESITDEIVSGELRVKNDAEPENEAAETEERFIPRV
jgi:hypothetical protein